MGQEIIKRILGFSMATWINAIITFIATPIVTCLFPPEELGKVNLFISYINILIPFVYLGFDQAFARFYHEPPLNYDSYSVGKSCYICSGIMFVIVSAVVLSFGGFFSIEIVGMESLGVVISIVMFIFGTFSLRFTMLNSRMENSIITYTIQSVLLTLITQLSFIVVVLKKPIATYAIEFRAACLFFVAVVFLIKFFIAGKKSPIIRNKAIIKDLSIYAIPLFPTVFLAGLNISLSQLMLSRFQNYAMVGVFSNGVTIASIIAVVQSGLNIFWAPFVYEYYKTEQQRLQKLHHIISFLMICFGLLMVLFQKPIYMVLVNPQYWESRQIFALLVISPVCVTISETLGVGIDLSKKTYLKIPVYVICVVVNFALCLLLIPKFEIVGAAFAVAISSLVMLLTKARLGEKFYRCSDNHLKLILGLIDLVIVAIINVVVVGIIKYVIVLVALIICIIIYRDEAIIMVSELKKILLGNVRMKQKH